MSGVNKAFLVGRLGKDPEVRHLESGVAVANFPLATSETYKDRNTGERKEITEWHNVVLWRGLADVASRYLHKGDMVYVEGKIRTRSWEKDGITRYTTEIVGDNMTMLTPKGSAGPMAETQASYANTPAEEENPVQTANLSQGEETDDLPF